MSLWAMICVPSGAVKIRSMVFATTVLPTIAGLGGAAVWQFAARAQQRTMPVVGFINAGSAETSADNAAAFRRGLSQSGYVEGQNVTAEYHWLNGQYDRMSAVVDDVVRRRVAVIALPGATTLAIIG